MCDMIAAAEVTPLETLLSQKTEEWQKTTTIFLLLFIFYYSPLSKSIAFVLYFYFLIFFSELISAYYLLKQWLTSIFKINQCSLSFNTI